MIRGMRSIWCGIIKVCWRTNRSVQAFNSSRSPFPSSRPLSRHHSSFRPRPSRPRAPVSLASYQQYPSPCLQTRPCPAHQPNSSSLHSLLVSLPSSDAAETPHTRIRARRCSARPSREVSYHGEGSAESAGSGRPSWEGKGHKEWVQSQDAVEGGSETVSGVMRLRF